MQSRNSARRRVTAQAKRSFRCTDRRYEMIDPKVQCFGDVALLTFNVVNYGKLPGQAESVLSRWNSTEIYRRVDGKWRIIHSHWSFTKPEVKQPGL